MIVAIAIVCMIRIGSSTNPSREDSDPDSVGDGWWMIVLQLLMDIGFYMVTMFIRMILVVGFLGYVYYENQFAIAVLSTMDPAFFYIVFAFFQYIFWEAQAVKSVSGISTYSWAFLGPRATFGETARKAMHLVSSLLIVLAIRQLAIGILRFVFELGFLMNSNGELVKYLEKYSLLRKLNVRLVRLVPLVEHETSHSTIGSFERTQEEPNISDGERVPMDASTPGPRIAHLASAATLSSVPSRSTSFTAVEEGRGIVEMADMGSGIGSKVGSKYGSIRGSMRATVGLVGGVDGREDGQAERGVGPKSARNRFSLRQFTRVFDARSVMVGGNTDADRRVVDVQVSKQVQSCLLPKNIEKSKSSQVRNWLYVQLVVRHPPALYVHGRRIELVNKSITKTAAVMLFDELLCHKNAIYRSQGHVSAATHAALHNEHGGGHRQARPQNFDDDEKAEGWAGWKTEDETEVADWSGRPTSTEGEVPTCTPQGTLGATGTAAAGSESEGWGGGKEPPVSVLVPPLDLDNKAIRRGGDLEAITERTEYECVAGSGEAVGVFVGGEPEAEGDDEGAQGGARTLEIPGFTVSDDKQDEEDEEGSDDLWGVGTPAEPAPFDHSPNRLSPRRRMSFGREGRGAERRKRDMTKLPDHLRSQHIATTTPFLISIHPAVSDIEKGLSQLSSSSSFVDPLSPRDEEPTVRFADGRNPRDDTPRADRRDSEDSTGGDGRVARSGNDGAHVDRSINGGDMAVDGDPTDDVVVSMEQAGNAEVVSSSSRRGWFSSFFVSDPSLGVTYPEDSSPDGGSCVPRVELLSLAAAPHVPSPALSPASSATVHDEPTDELFRSCAAPVCRPSGIHTSVPPVYSYSPSAGSPTISPPESPRSPQDHLAFVVSSPSRSSRTPSPCPTHICSSNSSTPPRQSPPTHYPQSSPRKSECRRVSAESSGRSLRSHLRKKADTEASQLCPQLYVRDSQFAVANLLALPERSAGGKGEDKTSLSGEDKREPTDDIEEYLTMDLVEIFMKRDEAEAFMKFIDVAGHGRINQDMFVRGVLYVYNLRLIFVKNMTNQRQIVQVVERMLAILTWFAASVVILLVIGVDLNTVLISGAAVLSAITVSLSFIYTNFINAVVFVAFHNPYNVGDRVRISNGPIYTVKAIRTYTTLMEDLHSKPVIFANAELTKVDIVNETRAKHSTFEITLSIDVSTPPRIIKEFKTSVSDFVAARPLDFVKDSFTFYGYSVTPGFYYEVAIWMTTVEGWGNWRKVWALRTEVFEHIRVQLDRLNISYHYPMQPIDIASFNSSQANTSDPSPAAPTSPVVAGANPAFFHNAAAHQAAWQGVGEASRRDRARRRGCRPDLRFKSERLRQNTWEETGQLDRDRSEVRPVRRRPARGRQKIL
eukprot:GHVS01042810.1.p1 GENE.GHVS01042810.1~~GHVS01042810.1.p1  ORF type:complete len:1550 (-),score=154.88 GHVS01042810.1:453-4616(-)